MRNIKQPPATRDEVMAVLTENSHARTVGYIAGWVQNGRNPQPGRREYVVSPTSVKRVLDELIAEGVVVGLKDADAEAVNANGYDAVRPGATYYELADRAARKHQEYLSKYAESNRAREAAAALREKLAGKVVDIVSDRYDTRRILISLTAEQATALLRGEWS